MNVKHATKRNRRRPNTWIMGALGALALVSSGCDDITNELLDVELPGDLPSADLEVPSNAQLLVQGAITEFECAFGMYIGMGGLLGNELTSVIQRTRWFVENRSISTTGQIWAENTCDASSTDGPGLYTTLSISRWMADNALGLLEEWKDNEVPGNRTELIGKAAAYAGYSYQLLGESMCEAVFDGGPPVPRTEILARAEERFTQAIQAAQSAGDNETLNMARIGRARARLHLDRLSEAAADARDVPDGFVKNAEYSSASNRTQNRLFLWNRWDDAASVEEVYQGLTFQGVPDPRVNVVNSGRVAPIGAPIWFQSKYLNRSSPIPIARSAEAKLIVAEAEAEAGNVPEAVAIINELHSAVGLPAYAGGTKDEVLGQIVEERSREFFLESQHYGDMLRYDIESFPALGEPFRFGGTYGPPVSCLPLPDIETSQGSAD